MFNMNCGGIYTRSETDAVRPVVMKKGNYDYVECLKWVFDDFVNKTCVVDYKMPFAWNFLKQVTFPYIRKI